MLSVYLCLCLYVVFAAIFAISIWYNLQFPLVFWYRARIIHDFGDCWSRLKGFVNCLLAWQLPKFRCTLFWRPYDKDAAIGGTILGSYLRKFPHGSLRRFTPASFPPNRRTSPATNLAEIGTVEQGFGFRPHQQPNLQKLGFRVWGLGFGIRGTIGGMAEIRTSERNV